MPPVLLILADWRHPNRVRKERYPIILSHGKLTQGAEDLLQPREIAGAEAEQVEVVRRAVRPLEPRSGGSLARLVVLMLGVGLRSPECEEQRALDDELSGVGGTAEPIQVTLQCIPHQHELELLLPLMRKDEQAG
jgi:hypothetical protein